MYHRYVRIRIVWARSSCSGRKISQGELELWCHCTAIRDTLLARKTLLLTTINTAVLLLLLLLLWIRPYVTVCLVPGSQQPAVYSTRKNSSTPHLKSIDWFAVNQYTARYQGFGCCRKGTPLRFSFCCWYDPLDTSQRGKLTITATTATAA